jgi:hypothetical protein
MHRLSSEGGPVAGHRKKRVQAMAGTSARITNPTRAWGKYALSVNCRRYRFPRPSQGRYETPMRRSSSIVKRG